MHDASNGRARPGNLLPRFLAASLLLGGLAACAPQNTATTYRAGELGRAAAVSYGTVVGLRPVTVQGGSGGVGTAAGAVAGGLGGSFIGGDTRTNIIAGLGGALLGGLAGNAIERGATRGQAVEFFVRRDEGGDLSVVQTNEEGLQAGERVVISYGASTRLSRAAGAPPASSGYGAPASYGTPSGYGAPPGYGAPSGYGAPGYNAPPYGAPGAAAPGYGAVPYGTPVPGPGYR